MKKTYSVLFCFFLCIALTGCNEPESTAATSVKAIYDLYILGETKGIESLGMTDTEIASVQTAYDESLKEIIRQNFSDSGQEIDEDVLNELCEARKEALAKMTATAEVTSESDGRATVVIHTTYFDEDSLDADAYYAARELTQETSFETPEEQQIFLMDNYTQNLITAYRNVKPSKDTTDITVDCVIQNNTWVPANMSSFGADLSQAVTGKN